MKTQPNSFGLFCLYDEGLLPNYDPEMENLLDKVGPFLACESSSRLNKGITDRSNPFHPYPNKTSLLLGDWYWNQGHKKSQAGFKQLLLDIIRDPEYHPKNVWNTNWMVINQNLGNSSIQDDKIEANCEWSDSGWKNTTVRICTPFHHRARHPGPKEYSIEGFHHCSLVDIICKNVPDPSHHRLFHYEPYELCWQPPHKAKDVGVYGELYTSGSFLTAHHQLQDSLPELGCALPQCIITLMLLSDAMQLTTFGMAKLWPLYIYMGNESKYMHCQLSVNLCSHAAYFHTVSLADPVLMLHNYVLK